MVNPSLLYIPDSSVPIGFQAILGFDLTWHLVHFDTRNAGIYAKGGLALEAMFGSRVDGPDGSPALDIGAGIQFKIARRASLYFDVQYVVGRVNKLELIFGYLNGK